MIVGKIKCKRKDFLVTEVLSPFNISSKKDSFYYYVIRKSGFTTFEAIETIAAYFKIPSSDIGYAGLKDEDGITLQYCSITKRLAADAIAAFNEKHKSLENFITIAFFQTSDAALQAGELLGNAFQLVIRNLDLEYAKKLSLQKKYSTCFINYYGTQRFGLPNGPKTTHTIGKHLLHEEYTAALNLLGNQPNEIGKKARKHTGESRLFFASIDNRMQAFYRSAFYSYLWNEEVKQHILKIADNNYFIHDQDGMIYIYSNDNNKTTELIQKNNQIPYVKVIPTQDGFKEIPSFRQLLIQLNIMFGKFFADDLHTNKWACEISFFLPAGCYATVAIPQLMREISDKFSNELLSVGIEEHVF